MVKGCYNCVMCLTKFENFVKTNATAPGHFCSWNSFVQKSNSPEIPWFKDCFNFYWSFFGSGIRVFAFQMLLMILSAYCVYIILEFQLTMPQKNAQKAHYIETQAACNFHVKYCMYLPCQTLHVPTFWGHGNILTCYWARKHQNLYCIRPNTIAQRYAVEH